MAGDDVVIEAEWDMVFDIAETPDLNSLQINGILTFENDGTDRKIKTNSLWVRAGTLNIGTEVAPFTAKANIHLLGDNSATEFDSITGIEEGNKNLVITGTANLFGKVRDER